MSYRESGANAMRRLGKIILLTVGVMLAGTGWAEETEPLVRSVILKPDSDAWSKTRLSFKFRDDSVIDRIGKLRNLSFLTLATTERTRFFLGVNEDGLVGLHFNTLARYGDDRVLELARLGENR